MRSSIRAMLTRPLNWQLVAICPLLAAGSTFAGAVALAVAVPAVLVAGCVTSRLVPSSLSGVTRTAILVIVTGALAASMGIAASALWPAVADAPGRYLSLAIAGVLLATHDAKQDSAWGTLRTTIVTGALCAMTLVALAAARELASRMVFIALTPMGAFILLGLGAAVATQAGRDRSPPRAKSGPAA